MNSDSPSNFQLMDDEGPSFIELTAAQENTCSDLKPIIRDEASPKVM